MKGDAKVLEYLQECLTAELTAINQYFLHAEMMENWGYERLGKITKKESIEDDAEKLLHRILFSTRAGDPALQSAHRPEREGADGSIWR